MAQTKTQLETTKTSLASAQTRWGHQSPMSAPKRVRPPKLNWQRTNQAHRQSGQRTKLSLTRVITHHHPHPSTTDQVPSPQTVQIPRCISECGMSLSQPAFQPSNLSFISFITTHTRNPSRIHTNPFPSVVSQSPTMHLR